MSPAAATPPEKAQSALPHLMLAIGAAACMLLLFIAPLKFGVVEIEKTELAMRAPHTTLEWLIFTYPNTYAFKPLLAIAVLTGLAMLLGAAPERRSAAAMSAGCGWVFLTMGIAVADKRLLDGTVSEWAHNPIKIQFVLYGTFFIAAVLFLARRTCREAAIIALITSCVLVSAEAVRQHYGGLEDMRREAARQAGCTNSLGVVQYTSFTNSLASSGNPNKHLMLTKLSGSRVFGTFVYPNSLGGFLLIMLPLCVGFCAGIRTPLARVLAGMGIASASAALLFSRSKASIVLAALGVLMLLALAAKAGQLAKKTFVGVSLAVVLVMAAMLAWGYGGGLGTRLKATGDARMDYWRAAAGMIAKKPVIGWGSGSYGRHYYAFAPKGAESTHLAHNAFLNLWVDYGVMGCAGCLLALGVPAIAGMCRAARPAGFNWCTAACAVAGSCFVLHNLVDFDVHIIGIVLPGLFALAAGSAGAPPDHASV